LIQKEDYQLDWHQSAIALHNKIRGFFPNCFTTFQGKNLKISETVPLDLPHLPEEFQPTVAAWQDAKDHLDAVPPPGTVAAIVKNAGPIVQTAAGGLLLRQVQPAGKRSQSGWDFANGNRLEVGERLGD
jgi:methionyl-tRNA formyltransferase